MSKQELKKLINKTAIVHVEHDYHKNSSISGYRYRYLKICVLGIPVYCYTWKIGD
jgi:hypothetical protein